jgi:hypothetical protein
VIVIAKMVVMRATTMSVIANSLTKKQLIAFCAVRFLANRANETGMSMISRHTMQ